MGTVGKVASILVPTDGSEGSIQAASCAGELARALNAKVTVLYIQSDEFLLEHSWGAANFIHGVPEGMGSVEQIRDALEKAAHEKVIPDSIDALGQLDSEPTVKFLWGHAAEQIISYADENDIDHIVMGSHGRSGLKRAFLGSVSQAVANGAKCPVTVVK